MLREFLGLFKRFRTNPVRGATVCTTQQGFDVWKGTVALKKKGQEPVLYSHHTIAGELSKSNSVRIDGENLVISRNNQPDLLINGYELKYVDDATLAFDWIFCEDVYQRRVAEFI